MPTKTIAGITVDVNDDGFFTDPEQWTEAMVPELARAENIDEVTEDHWRVIKFMRAEYFEKGTGPTAASWAKPRACPSKSFTGSSPKGRPGSPPGSPASPSPAAASNRAPPTKGR